MRQLVMKTGNLKAIKERRIWKEERERRNDLITCNHKKKLITIKSTEENCCFIV